MLKKTSLSIVMASGIFINSSSLLGLGIVNGKLEECGSEPNCVSTSNADSRHAVEAWIYDEALSVEDIQARLVQVLMAEDNARIITVRDHYIHAEFKSKIFKFVDDLEFLIDEDTHSIGIRSASRVGYFDFRVNRKRVNKLKESFLAL